MKILCIEKDGRGHWYIILVKNGILKSGRYYFNPKVVGMPWWSLKKFIGDIFR